MSKKIKMVRFQVAQLNVDPTQYKPYSHTLLAENVFVEIPVDEDEIVKYEAGKQTVLTLDGLTAILETLGTAVATMSESVRQSKLGH